MRRLFVLAAAVCGLSLPALADILPRGSAPAGAVVSRKSGEEARFIEVGGWRTVDVKQDLLSGDTLRTNAYGQLAILFSDRTQVRLGRNTTLVVKAIGNASDTVFGLQSGSLWARAERGGLGLTVETPAAAAAIRGTDWTLQVDDKGKTSLVVLEGLVQLSNPQGSVSVGAGEAAVASIGQAPTKIVIVDPKDREQMLFYLSLRNSFTWMPASPLPGRELRAERLRVLARPQAARTAEDWTLLAEAALANDGRDAAATAAQRARSLHPTGSQVARLDLVEAMLAGADRDYAGSARLFARAAPHLDPRRRAIAAYGGYYARALGDPSRVEREPRPKDAGPYGAMAEAWTAGFLLGIRPAIDVVKKAEARYPDDPSLPAMRAKLAILIDDRAQVEEATARALALDPDDPDALEARAIYRADFKSDLEGALADLERAAEIEPGSTDIFNQIALVQAGRGAAREAEAAFRRAIAIDPGDPVPHANLAIFLLDQDRLKEAKAEIDTALELDPAFDVGLVARGRYHLQRGDKDAAMADLLAGTTANPGYAQGLLLLAAAHYEAGEREAATQAMDNADRLDPNDPVTTSFRTAVAIDDYDAEKAVDQAQESLRRARARGGDFAALSANRDEGSTLNDAFRLAGLDAWGRYYGDAVFDPFAGASLVDQAVSGSPDPFFDDLQFGEMPVDPTANAEAFASFFQGLMLSPEMLAGRSRSANLLRTPFLEGAIGGGFTEQDGWNGSGEAELQGFVADPIPWSFYGNFKSSRTGEHREANYPGSGIPLVTFDLDDRQMTGVGYVTARPTPYDRVVAYFNAGNSRARLNDALIAFAPPLILPIAPGVGLPIDAITYDRTLYSTSWTAGAGWSHTFGYRNVLNAGVFASGLDQSSHEEGSLFFTPLLGGVPLGSTTIDRSVEQSSVMGALNHTVGSGDVTWRYGIEGGKVSQTRNGTTTTTILPPLVLAPVSTVTPDSTNGSVDLAFGRVYVDALWEATPDLKIEGALFGTWLGDPLSKTSADPRLGVAWSPADGQWLRAGYMRETSAIETTTLAPIGIVGLQANQVPLSVGGHTDTFGLRWDAEWTNRFFTSIDYQHQEIGDLSLTIPGGLETLDIARGRLDRVAGTADFRLGHGFGAFATLAYSRSENRERGANFGRPLPYVPETSARFGLTWVNPENVKVTLAETYVGPRAGDLIGTELADYWSTDAFLTWEPFDKRFSLELAAYNLFDQRFDVATNVPGWGRAFTGTFKVRF